MKYFLCLIVGGMLGASGAFWASYEPPPPPEPPPERDPNLVATVGDIEVFVSDLEAELARRRSDDVRTVLDEMLERLAVVAKARDSGVHEEYSVKRKLGNVIIGEVRERELDPLLASVAVGDEDAKHFYEENIEKYSRGRKIRLAMLVKSYSERWSAGKREAVLGAMREIRERAINESQTGRGFGALAIEGTEFQSARYKGGDVGWFTEGTPSRWPEEVVSVGFSLKESGETSDVIEAGERLFVVRLMDVREAAISPFDELVSSLKHSLSIQAKKDAERDWWREVRSGAEVAVFEDVLGRVLVPEGIGDGNGAVQPPALP